MMRKASQVYGWALGTLALGLLAVAAWSQTPGGAETIRITLYVPADAKVTVDGNPTKQTGPVRRFESPRVQPNKKYHYTFEITWMEKDEEQSIKKRVPVRVGDNTFDFRPSKGKTGDGSKKDGRKVDEAKKDEGKKPEDTAKKDEDGKKDDKKPEDEKKPADGKKAKDEKELKDKKKGPDDGAAAPRSRDFLFTYAATVTGLKPGQEGRIWVPIPPSNDVQRVRVVSQAGPFHRRTA
jgi:uncharacterized protein (TIGR03000 family)